MEIKTVAYPKVNLHLAVGRKNYDGYHEIASIFQLVEDAEYHDDLVINIEESDKLIIDIRGLEGIADKEDNTIYKACKLFCAASDFKARISVDVVKRIPSQAGLGGGSSDAGALILALNSIYPIGYERVMKIAAMVGSDVPFFASACKAAVVRGRGELVTPINPRDLKIRLYPNNNEKMSTAQAYKMLDDRKKIRPLQSTQELIDMYNGPIESWKFYNDFEAVNKPSQDIRYKLTGSGTCRFTVN